MAVQYLVLISGLSSEARSLRIDRIEYAADRIELRVSLSALSSVFGPTSRLFTRRMTASKNSKALSVDSAARNGEGAFDMG